MRRRWKRRLVWAALLMGVALLAIPATAARAAALVRLKGEKVMHRLVPAAVIVALGVVVGGSTLASASPDGESQTKLTLTAVELPQSEIYVDAGKKGNSPGDTVFFRERVLEGAKKAGSTDVVCVFMSERGARCSGTLRLPGGTLEATGVVSFSGSRSTLPIVGGTRRYAGVSGELTIIDAGAKRNRYEIELVG